MTSVLASTGDALEAADRAWWDGTLPVLAENFREYLVSQVPVVTLTQGSGGASPTRTAGGGGGCYDGPIPAYIVTRESGGNPGAVNASSGAYGCFQIMPFVWDANCAGLDRGVGGQIECANRISNGGTNLRPWAG